MVTALKMTAITERQWRCLSLFMFHAPVWCLMSRCEVKWKKCSYRASKGCEWADSAGGLTLKQYFLFYLMYYLLYYYRPNSKLWLWFGVSKFLIIRNYYFCLSSIHSIDQTWQERHLQNVQFKINAVILNFLFIKESLEKCIMVSTKKYYWTVFNTDNKN